MGSRPATDLLVVSGEALWPSTSAGRVRTAGLVEALAGRFSVQVVAPVEDPPPPRADGVAVGLVALPEEAPVPRLVAVASPASRRGRALLGPRRSQVLLQAVADHRPGAVLFAAGYLASAAPTIDRPVFVDFPALSVRRARPPADDGPGSRAARAAAALESLMARWWEPVEARRAVAVSAPTPDDVALLASWGAHAVLVPDGSSPSTWAEACAPLADAVERAVRAAAP